MATEAYCVKCKAKKQMEGEKVVKMKGKGKTQRYMLKGKCPNCGTTMCRIISADKARELGA